MFCSVGDSPDPLERMLAALRFAFTIQLKFVVSLGPLLYLL